MLFSNLYRHGAALILALVFLLFFVLVPRTVPAAPVQMQTFGDEILFRNGPEDGDVFLRLAPDGEGVVDFKNGSFRPTLNVITNNTSATARVLTAEESGSVCVLDSLSGGVGDIQFTLPAAAPGLFFYFTDTVATAAVDLKIQAGSGDTINGGTAAKAYVCTGDAVKQSCLIYAVDATRWIVLSESGTWSNNNS